MMASQNTQDTKDPSAAESLSQWFLYGTFRGYQTNMMLNTIPRIMSNLFLWDLPISNFPVDLSYDFAFTQ